MEFRKYKQFCLAFVLLQTIFQLAAVILHFVISENVVIICIECGIGIIILLFGWHSIFFWQVFRIYAYSTFSGLLAVLMGAYIIGKDAGYFEEEEEKGADIEKNSVDTVSLVVDIILVVISILAALIFFLTSRKIKVMTDFDKQLLKIGAKDQEIFNSIIENSTNPSPKMTQASTNKKYSITGTDEILLMNYDD